MFIVSPAKLTIDAEDPSNVAVKVDSVSRIRKELFSPAVGFRPIYAIYIFLIIYAVLYVNEIPIWAPLPIKLPIGPQLEFVPL